MLNKRRTAPKIDSKDWRNLPYDQWNVRTVHAMFADLNREKFGIETYVPMRNWAFEQGIIKRNLAQYGAEILSVCISEACAEYKPSEKYPQLTAGFVLAYMASRIIPRILANRQRKEAEERRRAEAERAAPSADEVKAWL